MKPPADTILPMRAETPLHDPSDALPPPPRWAMLLAALACVGLGALSLLRGFQGVTASPPLPFTIAFDSLGVLAAVFGVLAGLGRFNVAPAMALLCVAGASGVAALLGFDVASGGMTGALRDPFVLSRVALCGVILALAAVVVLIRKPGESLRRVLVGVVLLAATAGVSGVWTLPPLKAWLSSGNMLGLASAVVALIATAVLAIGLVSAAGHNLIRAFESGSAKDAPRAPVIK